MESVLKKERTIGNERQSALVRNTQFVDRLNLPFIVSVGAIAVMLLWAGAYKMTDPGGEGIVPLVTNSPLISWHFKLFGTYLGSDLIGVTEVVAAVLILTGIFRPKIGIIGTFISMLMFVVTSTMIITTPDTIVEVNGVGYMSFLGLFLYKDIIGLAVSLFLLSTFRKNAMAASKMTN